MVRRQWARQLPGRITTAGKLAGTILIHLVTESRRWRDRRLADRLDRRVIFSRVRGPRKTDGENNGSTHDPVPENGA